MLVSSEIHWLLNKINPANARFLKTIPMYLPFLVLTESEYGVLPGVQSILDAGKANEEKWVEHGLKLLSEVEKLTKQQCVSWAAFHASSASDPQDPPVVNSLLPLLYEKAATLSMIKHGMSIQQQIIEYLNRG